MSKYGYEVLGDANEGVVAVLLRLGDFTDAKGDVLFEENESGLFYPGNVISEDDIATHIKEKYEAGDEHTLSLFKRVKLDENSEDAEDTSEDTSDEEVAEEAPKTPRKRAAKSDSAKSESAE